MDMEKGVRTKVPATAVVSLSLIRCKHTKYTLSFHSELLVMARDHGDPNLFIPLLLFPFRSSVLVRVFDIFIRFNLFLCFSFSLTLFLSLCSTVFLI